MPIVWLPRNGGYVKNMKMTGEGFFINEKESLVMDGTFKDGILDGEGMVVKYADNLINIRRGSYSNGKENGAVYEYVFPKTLWREFLDKEEGIDSATRYTHVFQNGAWKSTSETTVKKITGFLTKHDEKNHFISFSLVELN